MALLNPPNLCSSSSPRRLRHGRTSRPHFLESFFLESFFVQVMPFRFENDSYQLLFRIFRVHSTVNRLLPEPYLLRSHPQPGFLEPHCPVVLLPSHKLLFHPWTETQCAPKAYFQTSLRRCGPAVHARRRFFVLLGLLSLLLLFLFGAL